MPSFTGTASSPLYMTSIQPSVVIISRRVSIPFGAELKFSIGTVQSPSKSSQSYLVITLASNSSSSNSHLPNAPLKKLTPTIANMRRNKKQTITTFDMAGSDESRAFTINFMPWFLEIILRGLSALKALRAFNDCKFEDKLALPPALSSAELIELLT